MVKGISKQVIVVQSPDPNLFEQAIFILRNNAVADGVTEERLLQEAEKIVRGSRKEKKTAPLVFGALWAFGGAAFTAIAWVITSIL